MGSKTAGKSSSKRAAEGLSAKDTIDRIAASKVAHRRELARLPFEDKFKMVVEMNRVAAQARAGVKRVR
ncbi:MAG: hypothetical protein ACJ79H_07370 [Myxococcales bacterium]